MKEDYQTCHDSKALEFAFFAWQLNFKPTLLDIPRSEAEAARVFARLPKVLIGLALACSIGFHWAFFQAVAWAGMVVSYSQDDSLSAAVVKTFDGLHPCKLCGLISKGKRSEKKSEFQLQVVKLKIAYAPVLVIFSPSPLCYEMRVSNDTMSLRTLDPPVPPPRSSIC